MWKELPKKVRDVILYGSGEDDVKFIYDDGSRAFETKKPFEGVIVNLERRFRETESDWAREDIEKYFSAIPCKTCHGHRLRPRRSRSRSMRNTSAKSRRSPCALRAAGSKRCRRI